MFLSPMHIPYTQPNSLEWWSLPQLISVTVFFLLLEASVDFHISIQKLSYSKGMPLYYCISSACLILFLLLLFTSTPFPYLFMTFSIRNYPGTSWNFYDTKEYLHSTGTLQKELQDCIISSLILFLSHRRNGCCHNNHDFFDILLLLIRRGRFACASSTSVIL